MADHSAPGWVTETPSSGLAFFEKSQRQYEAEDGVDQALAEAKRQAFSHLSIRLQAKLEKWSDQALNNLAFQDREKAMPYMARLLKQRVQAELPAMDLTPYLTPELTTSQVFVDQPGKQVYAMVKLPKTALADVVQAQATAMAAQLRDYLDVSSKGSHLQQVRSMAPALPTLMAYQRSQTLLADQFDRAPVSESAQLASMFDAQFNRLVKAMVVRVDAITRETEAYDKPFKQALADQGYNLSARRPDVTVRYFVEPQTSGTDEAQLLTDVELVDVNGEAVSTLSEVYAGQGKTPELAEQAAIGKLSHDLTDSLVMSTYQYAQKVNEVNFNR
ncbi:hypothetical protein [Thiomicrospira sp. WB1]|uniref:hypothetical protein n=1 Tax=Thiomicrospira sp. WB1 TaxID=1685380 RepID=UPI000748FD83|nr:hypothetical protein [Thiomicrospira sp. WB1]KUJ71246.1 hypothetical protein AVO41_10355 [Thiomicrospira sp. WB1]